MKRNLVHWIMCLLFLPSLGFAEKIKLTQLLFQPTQQGSQVVFELTQTPSVQVYILIDPDRLAIDFKHTRLATDLQKMNTQKQVFKKIRSGYPDGHTLRLVFDLKKEIDYRLNIKGKTVSLNMIPLSTSSSSEKKVSVTKKTPIISCKKNPTITVVIDPGHGGQDPGAVGVYGTQEKSVVLAIAKQLASLINQNPHMHAILTRDSDVFIPLVDRLKLARKGRADLFIAIHADSYFNKKSNGASVYALSRRGATSVAARWLSNRDNHSELGGLNLKELEDQSIQLRSVLIDLAQTATIVDSLRLGTSLLHSLDQVTDLHYRRVEQAPFLVLKSPDIPSILVETGFLSNPKEEKKLRNCAYQHQMAHAIFQGIQVYLKKYGTAVYSSTT